MNFFKSFLENMRLFFVGALDMRQKSVAHIENEIVDTTDEFLILCFGDMLGIDLPTTYYALELLPYLTEDIEPWQRRMLSKKSVWEEKGSKLDMDP